MKITPFVAIFVALLGSRPVGALTFIGTSPAELCRSATAEVVATAERVHVRRGPGGFPVTWARLRVDYALRGRTMRRWVSVHAPGGELGGVVVRFPGLPAYHRGGRYWVCLRGRRPVWVDPVGRRAPTYRALYTFLGGDTPARFFQYDVAYGVAAGDAALGPVASRAAVLAGLTAWAGVANLGLTVAPGDAAPQQGCPTAPLVMFDDPYGLIATPVNCSGVLALGGYCGGAATTVVNGVTFHQITTAVITMADGFEVCPFWNATNVSEVLTHELGHTLGLGHSVDRDATMYAYAHFDGRGAALRADDIAGAQFVYPATATTTTSLPGATSSTSTSSSSTSTSMIRTTSTSATTSTRSTTTTATSSTTTTTGCPRHGKRWTWRKKCPKPRLAAMLVEAVTQR